MTRLLKTALLLAFPHGGQAGARANAAAALAAHPVRNSLTPSATSTTANSFRNVASG